MKKTAPIAKNSKPSRVKSARKQAPARKKAPAKEDDATNVWRLRLYIAGQTPKSLAAFANLEKLCQQYLNGRYELEIIDLVGQPHLAQTDQILALPTLVRKLPEPIKRIIGDLSNLEKVMVGLDLKAIPANNS